MAKIHVVISQKGGVGKTTIAVNLAAIVSATLGGDPENPPTLVVSLDPQASAVWWAERTNLDELPFDFDQMDDRPEELLKLPDSGYEHVFIDAPGSLARPAALARALDVAAEHGDALVPVVAESLAKDPTERTIRELVEPRGVPYHVVRNLWDPRDGHGDLNWITNWLNDQGFRYANTSVRRYKMHRTAAEEGRVVTQYPKGRTATEAMNDFLSLALELGYGGKVTA